MNNPKNINLDEAKTFFDPHPGLMGASIPIPLRVKRVADQLNGKTMTLREALDEFKETTDGEFTVREGAIFLKIKGDGVMYMWHLWRVIKYR